MADFYKIAGMPRVIGAVDGSLIPIRAPYNQEHLYVCHKGFHAIIPWQCAMRNCCSPTLCADGMAVSMIQPFLIPACCTYTLKVVPEEMVGCWGIVDMASSHICWPPSGLIVCQLSPRGSTRRPTPRHETPLRGPLAYGRLGFVASMFLVGHYSSNQVVAALS